MNTGHFRAATLRKATAAVLLLTLAGCSTVRPVAEPAAWLRAHSPGRIWVERASGGGEVLVEAPRVVSDTVFGFDPSGGEVAVPLAEIRRLRVKQLHGGRTALAVVLGLAGTLGLALAVFGGGEEPEIEPPEDAIAPAPRSR